MPTQYGPFSVYFAVVHIHNKLDLGPVLESRELNVCVNDEMYCFFKLLEVSLFSGGLEADQAPALNA